MSVLIQMKTNLSKHEQHLLRCDPVQSFGISQTFRSNVGRHTQLHGVTSQIIVPFVVTAVRSSNLKVLLTFPTSYIFFYFIM
jgi:hypothetical protein